MGFVDWFRLRFRPPRLVDPDFGPLVFMYISHAPERSYWEAEWEFPPVGYKVSIGLAGDREGPSAESRAFFLSRVAEFERTVELVRPQLDSVCRKWLGRPLADDIWADVKLAGLDVQDPNGTPLSWEVSFETLGNRWLGIAIPIVGDVVGEATVDT